MNQIIKFPPCGIYYFPSKFCDKTYICLRCLVHHKFWIDHICYSTHESALLKHIVKNRKKIDPYGRRLKETELLKVTNNQATEKTMTVGKLNASLVTAFVKEPGMILNNIQDSKYRKEVKKKGAFFKVREKGSFPDTGHRSECNSRMKSTVRFIDRCTVDMKKPGRSMNLFNYENHESKYNDVSVSAVKEPRVENMSNANFDIFEKYVNSNDMPESKILEENVPWSTKSNKIQTEQPMSEVIEDLSFSSQEPDLHTYFQIKNSNLDDMDKSDQLVLSFIDVCVNNGMLENAYAQLCTEKAKEQKSSTIYDIVLKGYSKKGEWDKIEKLINLMEHLQVPPSCTTFTIYLDSLFRISESESYKMRKAKAILTTFQSMGYKVVDLFTKTRMNCYERQNILTIVNWFYPNFKPGPLPVSIHSRCRLVADLYNDDYNLKSPLPFLTADEMAKAIEEQLTIEAKPFYEIESVVKRGFSCPKHKQNWLDLVELWKNSLHVNFIRQLSALKEEVQGKSHVPNLFPFLSCLSAEEFVNLMLHEIYRICLASEGFTMSTAVIHRQIGSRVWYRYSVKKKIKSGELVEKYKQIIDMYYSWYLNPTGSIKSAREKWSRLLWDNPDIMCMGERNISWPEEVKTKIGKFIFDIILRSAIIPSSLLSSDAQKKSVPAFYLVLRCRKGTLSEQVKFHPFVGLLYRRANINTLFFEVDQLPMFCPPKPWTSADSGGFYILPTRLLRPTQFNYNSRMIQSVNEKNLSVIFDSLNQLQSVPWVVNEKVLDIALRVFQDGGSGELNVPTYPDLSSIPEPLDNLDSNARAAAYRERLSIIQQRQEEFGLWCEGLYKLSLANHFRKKIFWLPHNLDFRGRVYPIPPHINHITSDLYRSLLLFAKKERLGPNGLDWLKIHAVNLMGTHSKRPINERLKYANEVLDDILDSAEKPLDGKGWWTKSEEPWQTLAACFEIRSALESGDPQNYQTGFPVHQDGSCNGLQHYAALGRDSIGAASVNLSPAPQPQDVYSVVANIIEEIRKKDAQNGIEIASILEGFITRKVIKQTVMTTVYGVTLYGAKLQISQRLEEKHNFPAERVNEAARYLSAKVFEALKEMFTSAKEIQDWFLKCANIIVSSYGASVSWVTPLGLPVTQPYFKNFKNKREILTKLAPDKRKQKNAFPPNFIHSLDSSHMMLTALYCGKAGVSFASVHDCFWTHPSKVDVMNRICREKFIALHSEDILKDLACHFVQVYNINRKSKNVDRILMDVPKTGNFDLNSVLESVYFFS